MEADKNWSFRILLDMCKISYTENQLMKLEKLLSNFYVIRKCSVRLEKTLTVPDIPDTVKTLFIPKIGLCIHIITKNLEEPNLDL